MEKKLYNTPLVEVMKLQSLDLMHLQNPSTGEEFPGGPAGIGIAPRKHWTDVF